MRWTPDGDGIGGAEGVEAGAVSTRMLGCVGIENWNCLGGGALGSLGGCLGGNQSDAAAEVVELAS